MRILLKSIVHAFRYMTLSRKIKKEFHAEKYKSFECCVRVNAWAGAHENLLEYRVSTRSKAKQYFLCIPKENSFHTVLYSNDIERVLNISFEKDSAPADFARLVVTELSPEVS